MKVKSVHQMDAQAVSIEGARGVSKRLLIGHEDGAPSFSMRLFDVEPGGHTPFHSHPFEHEVYVVEGEGALMLPGGEKPLKNGSVVLVPPDEEHQFRNTGGSTFRFICVVPKEYE